MQILVNQQAVTHTPVHKLYSSGTVTLRISDGRQHHTTSIGGSGSRVDQRIRKRSAGGGIEKIRKRSGVYATAHVHNKSVIKPVILIKKKVSDLLFFRCVSISINVFVSLKSSLTWSIPHTCRMGSHYCHVFGLI